MSLPIVETSQVGDARRQAVLLADALGFGSVRRGEVALVVTELATNLVRHAKKGELVIRSYRDEGGPPGVEVLSLDRGPGIADAAGALRDGFSTGGTPGTGLGAVRRLSTLFDLYSGAGGTVVLSRVRADDSAAAAPAPLAPVLDVGVVCLPKAGEEACGDAWALEQDGTGRAVVVVADGLGHGLLAADASRQAVTTFRGRQADGTVRRMEAMHAALKPTRGAAVATADLRPDRGEIAFTGVGNIAAALVSDAGVKNFVSHNGTVGAQAQRMQEFVVPWPAGALLVMHSDGIGTQWRLDAYPGLRARHPSVVAAVLYRDFRRERDDATALVVRVAEAAAAPPAV